MTVNNTSTVARILRYQVLIVAVVSLGFAVGGWQKAYFSLLGGLAAFIPNLYFALRIRAAAGQEPKKVLQAFYKGESVKLVLTAVVFILILQIPNIEIMPLFAGYIAALSVFWLALLMR